ncbi:MAG: ABC transporter permease [Bifidobacteriaceae bacterium]|jgi:ribose transport system permease protein|nr:ABC transporter permease [Bifidobacteriaceae bacterium]
MTISSPVVERDSKALTVLRWVLGETGILVALLALIGVFIVIAPNFLSAANIANILTQITLNTILATGMTFVILVGGIDLSVGSALALCAMVSGLVLTIPGLPVPVAVLGCIVTSVAVGLGVGFLNGFISETWKVPSFIVTLGMLNIARGAALQTTNAKAVFGFPQQFNDFGTASLAGIPCVFLVALAFVILGQIVLSKTVFGRVLFAVGNNEESARLAGHRTASYKVAAFCICGLMVGVAAVIYMTRLHTSTPIIGNGYELNAIAAVIIGGASLFGGKGSLVGTLLGASLLGVLTDGLLLLGVGDFMRQMVTGAVIIFAVIIDFYRGRFSDRLLLRAAL